MQVHIRRKLRSLNKLCDGLWDRSRVVDADGDGKERETGGTIQKGRQYEKQTNELC